MEDPVGVGEGVEKLQGGSRGGSAMCGLTCSWCRFRGRARS